jgi:hypothetical protein
MFDHSTIEPLRKSDKQGFSTQRSQDFSPPEVCFLDTETVCGECPSTHAPRAIGRKFSFGYSGRLIHSAVRPRDGDGHVGRAAKAQA